MTTLDISTLDTDPPPTPPETPPESSTFSDVFSSRSPSPAAHSPSQSPSQSTTSRYRSSSPPPAADLQRLQRSHTTSGYRDGIAVGKSSYIQDGFDEGYLIGARIGLKLGWVLGALSTLCQTFPEDSELVRVRDTAERELVVERVYGKEWWDENVVWRWGVSTSEEALEGVEEEAKDGTKDEKEEKKEVTLEEVVEAFPVWRRWREAARVQAERKGLDVRMLEYVEEETSS